MSPAWKLPTFLLALLTPFTISTPTCPRRPPNLVNLGYARHVPTFTNTTASGHKIHVYKNIRFANAPTGELRFRLPDTQLPHTPGVQDGGGVPELSNHCISSAPGPAPFPPYNGTTWGQEDCLFLDVYVPEGVKPGDKVPVLHWFVGSAYAFGSKEMFSNPLGLFEVMDEKAKFIFVANNYRLGVTGWSYMPGEDMVANLGMHDCLAAARWTEKYIRRFGGDPGRVTVMGQSAGAGIIALLSVLNGGKGKLPFQQGILSSPAIPPRRNPIDHQRKLWATILEGANCTTLECLRAAPEETMRRLNTQLINDIPSDAGGGVFGPAPGFGPVPDGTFIQDAPQILWSKGSYHKELKGFLVGNTANEGMGLAHDEGFPEYFPIMVRQALPTASDETIAYIQSHYDFGDNPAKLGWDWTTDAIFACNAANVATAYQDRARRYIFSVPPAFHGQDLFYFFYTDQQTTPVEDLDDARRYQRNLLSFLHGRTHEFPLYGAEKTITNITSTEMLSTPLSADLRARCRMINRVVLDPANGA